MTSYVSLLVCMISGAGVPQKCRLQKLVQKSRFVQIAKFFCRSYFYKVWFQIKKYIILGDGHFKPPRETCFFQALLRWGLIEREGLKERGDLFNLAKCINGTDLRFLGVILLFLTIRKLMVTILHRELEHKVEKVQHMKLEVM